MKIGSKRQQTKSRRTPVTIGLALATILITYAAYSSIGNAPVPLNEAPQFLPINHNDEVSSLIFKSHYLTTLVGASSISGFSSVVDLMSQFVEGNSQHASKEELHIAESALSLMANYEEMSDGSTTDQLFWQRQALFNDLKDGKSLLRPEGLAQIKPASGVQKDFWVHASTVLKSENDKKETDNLKWAEKRTELLESKQDGGILHFQEDNFMKKFIMTLEQAKILSHLTSEDHLVLRVVEKQIQNNIKSGVPSHMFFLEGFLKKIAQSISNPDNTRASHNGRVLDAPKALPFTNEEIHLWSMGQFNSGLLDSYAAEQHEQNICSLKPTDCKNYFADLAETVWKTTEHTSTDLESDNSHKCCCCRRGRRRSRRRPRRGFKRPFVGCRKRRQGCKGLALLLGRCGRNKAPPPQPIDFGFFSMHGISYYYMDRMRIKCYYLTGAGQKKIEFVQNVKAYGSFMSGGFTYFFADAGKSRCFKFAQNGAKQFYDVRLIKQDFGQKKVNGVVYFFTDATKKNVYYIQEDKKIFAPAAKAIDFGNFKFGGVTYYFIDKTETKVWFINKDGDREEGFTRNYKDYGKFEGFDGITYSYLDDTKQSCYYIDQKIKKVIFVETKAVVFYGIFQSGGYKWFFADEAKTKCFRIFEGKKILMDVKAVKDFGSFIADDGKTYFFTDATKTRAFIIVEGQQQFVDVKVVHIKEIKEITTKDYFFFEKKQYFFMEDRTQCFFIDEFGGKQVVKVTEVLKPQNGNFKPMGFTCAGKEYFFADETRTRCYFIEEDKITRTFVEFKAIEGEKFFMWSGIKFFITGPSEGYFMLDGKKTEVKFIIL